MVLLVPLMSAAALLGTAGCAPEDTARLYYAEPIAPSLDADAVANLEHLGATLVDLGVNFSVYSARADRVDLLLFDGPDDALPSWEFEMTRFGDVWNVYVEGVGLGQLYGFVAWGPNWVEDPDFYPGSRLGFVRDVDEDGNRFNPNKLLFDPYGRAFTRDHDWSLGSLGTGESRREESTWAAAAKSVVVQSTYTWSDAEQAWRDARASGDHPGHDWTDLVIYEVHPKGFTKNGVEGVDHPGTFRGIGEYADYLADLGITAVELMPVHEKPLDGGYWGYNPLSWFVPELSYSADYDPSDPGPEVTDEFKWMVDQLHQRGIEVILDVVFNHTGEGGLWREKLYYNDWTPDEGAVTEAVNLDSVEVAGLYSYRGLDNWSWYALSEDGQTYWNNTGVGNEVRANHTPGRRAILDALRYMVEELHVDGFRFDLAPILGEEDQNYNQWAPVEETVLQEIVDDPVLQQWNTRIIAEPWSAGGDAWKLGAFPLSSTRTDFGWGEWNAYFRDWWRSFVNDDGWALNTPVDGGKADGGFVMTGSYDLFSWNGRKPWHSVNFVTVHDGFTMYDLFSYDEKQNGCGVLNPICCDDPTSAWCETDNGEDNNRSRDWGMDNEPLKRQLMRNMFTALMISHGTPLILGGDEWLRTQYGNNNAYTDGADNEWNWFRWGEWQAYDERHRMHDFVRKIIRLRKDHAYAFAPYDWGAGAPFAWKDEFNQDAGDATWSSRHIMIHYYDASYGPELAILINMEPWDVDFQLPGGEGTWYRLVDTQAYFDQGDDPNEADWGLFVDDPTRDTRTSWNITLDSPDAVGADYVVKSRSIVILERR